MTTRAKSEAYAEAVGKIREAHALICAASLILSGAGAHQEDVDVADFLAVDVDGAANELEAMTAEFEEP